MLVARSLPASGGETIFVDMRKAYESLPNSLKATVSKLRAVHSSRQVFSRKSDERAMFMKKELASQNAVHPVVIKHPLSGRKTLFVNPAFTVRFEGQTVEESKELLEILYHHAVQKENMTLFRWTPGSAVLWDNRAVWHCAANNYKGMYRLMHRITMEGTILESADPSQIGSMPLDRSEEVSIYIPSLTSHALQFLTICE